MAGQGGSKGGGGEGCERKEGQGLRSVGDGDGRRQGADEAGVMGSRGDGKAGAPGGGRCKGSLPGEGGMQWGGRGRGKVRVQEMWEYREERQEGQGDGGLQGEAGVQG